MKRGYSIKSPAQLIFHLFSVQSVPNSSSLIFFSLVLVSKLIWLNVSDRSGPTQKGQLRARTTHHFYDSHNKKVITTFFYSE